MGVCSLALSPSISNWEDSEITAAQLKITICHQHQSSVSILETEDNFPSQWTTMNIFWHLILQERHRTQTTWFYCNPPSCSPDLFTLSSLNRCAIFSIFLFFFSKVHSITQDQYQDVTEERAITELCGYPLCCNILTNVPSKIYHISTRQNKVYDITDRKVRVL